MRAGHVGSSAWGSPATRAARLKAGTSAPRHAGPPGPCASVISEMTPGPVGPAAWRPHLFHVKQPATIGGKGLVRASKGSIG